MNESFNLNFWGKWFQLIMDFQYHSSQLNFVRHSTKSEMLIFQNEYEYLIHKKQQLIRIKDYRLINGFIQFDAVKTKFEIKITHYGTISGHADVFKYNINNVIFHLHTVVVPKINHKMKMRHTFNIIHALPGGIDYENAMKRFKEIVLN